jgi:hypothetical protein
MEPPLTTVSQDTYQMGRLRSSGDGDAGWPEAPPHEKRTEFLARVLRLRAQELPHACLPAPTPPRRSPR